jgi:hypothetical protein
VAKDEGYQLDPTPHSFTVIPLPSLSTSHSLANQPLQTPEIFTARVASDLNEKTPECLLRRFSFFKP